MPEWRARDVGAIINQQRRVLNLSARELGRQAGVDGATVLRIERGQSVNPSTATLHALADALGLTVS